MKLSRLITTLTATLGLVFAFVYFAGDVSAHTTLEPAADDTGQIFTPPPAASTIGGTSVWWFVLVAAATVVATVVVLSAVRTLRTRRMIPTVG